MHHFHIWKCYKIKYLFKVKNGKIIKITIKYFQRMNLWNFIKTFFIYGLLSLCVCSCGSFYSEQFVGAFLWISINFNVFHNANKKWNCSIIIKNGFFLYGMDLNLPRVETMPWKALKTIEKVLWKKITKKL